LDELYVVRIDFIAGTPHDPTTSASADEQRRFNAAAGAFVEGLSPAQAPSAVRALNDRATR
jgi:hypothetical protein